jgi:hypothetical protein
MEIHVVYNPKSSQEFLGKIGVEKIISSNKENPKSVWVSVNNHSDITEFRKAVITGLIAAQQIIFWCSGIRSFLDNSGNFIDSVPCDCFEWQINPNCIHKNPLL